MRPRTNRHTVEPRRSSTTRVVVAPGADQAQKLSTRQPGVPNQELHFTSVVLKRGWEGPARIALAPDPARQGHQLCSQRHKLVGAASLVSGLEGRR